MKKAIFVLFLFVFSLSFSQLIEGGGSFESAKGGTPLGKIKGSYSGNSGGLYSQAKKFSYDKVFVEGSQYLFENWKNKGEIYIGNKKYIVPNLNFSLDKQAFMSKIENDSVFVYDISRDDKVLINGRLFKKKYDSKDSKEKIYEVIYSGKDLSVLKEYFIKVQEAHPNPMLNRQHRKIMQRDKLLVYKSDKFNELKPQKKSLLSFIDKEKLGEVKKFISDNNLSYKKEKDIVRIFMHYEAL